MHLLVHQLEVELNVVSQTERWLVWHFTPRNEVEAEMAFVLVAKRELSPQIHEFLLYNAVIVADIGLVSVRLFLVPMEAVLTE